MNVPDSPPPYDAVLFDCDSTLSRIEGIDELARGMEAEIAALTDAAMSGEVALEDVYAKRLEKIRPDRAAVEAVGRLYVERAMPHAVELVAALHALGKRVYVVSGGLRTPVAHLAAHLRIPDERVHAVAIHHDDAGAYADFDRESPLARSGGKPEIVRELGERRAVLVGDGTSDLEAAPFLARFIGFGGVKARPAVFEAARVTCAVPDLAALVPCLFSGDELARLEEDPAHAPLIRAARALTPKD